MTAAHKIAFHTLGCKLNFSETSTLSRMMEKEGFARVEFDNSPDVYVINTCSVTENADKECRTIVRRALRINPDARVVIVGCYAQLKPAEIANIEGVDMVLGAKEKFQLPEHLRLAMHQPKRTTQTGEVYSCDINDVNLFTPGYSLGDRTRAFLKVQDGCDYPCTYCTIPLARGKSRSDTIPHVVEQAQWLAGQGIREIVLTGVNIGDFGIDGETGTRHNTFFDLVKTLDETTDIERYRISSIEPNLLADEIIDYVSTSKHFVPHFHIPMQSGSDTVLGMMRRRYKTALYKSRIEKIKTLMPHCAIGVDVIVGFPGETEEMFLETYNFLNALDITYLHVFTYSERTDTIAAELPGVVPIHTRHERNKRLRILSEKKRAAFYQSQLQSIRPVLFESDNNNGTMQGYTDNYVRVATPYDIALSNTIQQVSLDAFDGDTVAGAIQYITEPV